MGDFQSFINGSKPVVVDFFAEWCGPCKMMGPVLHELKTKVGDSATILKMDIDKNPSYAEQYNVQSVPTLMIFKEGRVIWRKSGVTQANEILNHINSHI